MGRARGRNHASFEAVVGPRRGRAAATDDELAGALARAAQVNDLDALQSAVSSAGPGRVLDHLPTLRPLGSRYERWTRQESVLIHAAAACGLDSAKLDAQARDRFLEGFLRKLVLAADTDAALDKQPVRAWAADHRAQVDAETLRDWLEHDPAGESLLLHAFEPPPRYANTRDELGLKPGEPLGRHLSGEDVAAALEPFRESWHFYEDPELARFELQTTLRALLEAKAAR